MKKYPMTIKMASVAICACALALTACSAGWGPNEARSGAPLGPQPDGLLKSNGFDTGPRRISGGAAVYPFSASMKNDCGSALLEFTIGEDGKTKDIKIVESSGPYFGSHSAYAVQSWLFEPARKDGKPVAVTVRQDFTFTPDGAFTNPETCGPNAASAPRR